MPILSCIFFRRCNIAKENLFLYMMILIVNYLIVSLWFMEIGAYDDTLPCEKRFTLVTDFSKENCDDDFYVHNYHDCFPGCLKKPEGNGNCLSDKDCPPGFYCPPALHPWDNTKCEINEESCFKYHIDFNDNPYFKNMWTPDCLNDGTWAPKQCKGESANGRCFCYDGNGKRIFGQEFSTRAKDMTCDCSRRRTELKGYVTRSYITTHCDSMGNYEPLQCNSKLCWCADSKTGKVTSTVVPDTAMTLLPCYKKEDVGDIYLRQCESERYGQVAVAEKLQTHGTLYANFQPLFCDPDGSYGSFKILGSEIYCIWRDNTNLESWHSQIINGDISAIDCNCARDRKIYQLQGLTHTLKCNPNGNYESMQSLNGKYVCIDSDGFATTEELTEKPDCDELKRQLF